MAGELMRTPILEKTVKEITGIEMSKTILTDECLSVGCSLYGALLKVASLSKISKVFII